MITSYISTKSPYMLFTTTTTKTYGVFDIFIYQGTQTTGRSINPTYQLVSSTFDTKGNVEISPFIDSITEQQFDGMYATNGVWVDHQYTLTDDIGNITGSPTTIISEFALPGYSYFEDGLNYISVNTNGLLIDNDEIQIAVGEGVTVPIFTDVTETVTLKDVDNNTLNTVDVTSLTGNTSSSKIFYYQFVGEYPGELGSLEVKSAVGTTTIKIVEVTECKYDPIKITFLNRYGVLQDLWFFKRKDVTMNVTQDEYKRSLIDISTESYNTFNHQKQVYNKVAKEVVDLNSGFVPESFNPVFKQLLISDRVWMTGDINGVNTIRPVNVTNSAFDFKYKLDEKLINHSIKLDLAFDTINNIA